MATNNKIKYSSTLTANQFMGIKIPELEYFKIKLIENVKVGTNAGIEVSKEHNYEIVIGTEIAPSYREELSEQLQVAFKLKWAPYNYKLQAYEYYSSGHIPDEEKAERLKKVFEVLINFESYYKEAIQDSLKMFKEDAIEKKTYSDHEVAVKFNEKRNCFVVLALRFMGEGKYPILANASSQKGKISQTDYKETGFFDEFVNWEKQKKDLYYFEISPESYINIKSFIEIKEKTKEIFEGKQMESLEKIGKDNLAFFDEENLFGLKVIYDEKLKMFEFFCKGYTEPMVRFMGTEKKTNRTLIPLMALEYVLSKQLTERETEDNFVQQEDGSYKSDDFILDGDLELGKSYTKHKYHLKFEEESSKKDKKLFLSLEYNEVLKEIISNYEKNRNLFSRTIKDIKITNENNTSITGFLNKQFPSIYLNGKGDFFLVLSTREREQTIKGATIGSEIGKDGEVKAPRISKGVPASLSMKTIPITHDEALHFLYEHTWSSQIERNTIYLNTELWMTNENKPQINEDDRNKSFNILMLNNKLQGDLKNANIEKKKSKSIKI